MPKCSHVVALIVGTNILTLTIYSSIKNDYNNLFFKVPTTTWTQVIIVLNYFILFYFLSTRGAIKLHPFCASAKQSEASMLKGSNVIALSCTYPAIISYYFSTASTLPCWISARGAIKLHPFCTSAKQSEEQACWNGAMPSLALIKQ